MDEPSAPQPKHDPTIDARLLRLEAEVARLQTELAALTSGTHTTSETRTPPPLRPDLTQPPQPPTAVPPASTPEEPPPAPRSPDSSPRPPWTPAFKAARSASGASLEDRLGGLWFNRIGIVLLLLGTSWFLKLAIDRGWIVPSPIARVIAGLVAGAAIVLWSERFRHKGFWAFSYSLKALGSGVLYLSLWAGFRLYNLLPAPLALGLMIAVTAWNAFMAWAQDAELLAAYALAGGLATPILLSTGGNHEIFLFTYLLTIDAAAVALVRLKLWPRLLFAAFPVTVAYFIGWYLQYWTASALSITVLFIGLFGAVFATVALGNTAAEHTPSTPSAARRLAHTSILLPLANAAFLGLALYSVLQESGHHAWLPWMVLVLAAAYLALMRAPQSRTAAAIHLSLAIVFLTIAIPLKASGHWITAGWLVEGLALLWVASRLSSGPADQEPRPTRVLRSLALGALALGFCGIVFHLFPPDPVAKLWSSDTATALLGVAVYAITAALALRQATLTGPSRTLTGPSLTPTEPRRPPTEPSLTESASATTHLPQNTPAPNPPSFWSKAPEFPYLAVQGWHKVLVAAFMAIDLIAILLALAEVLFSWGTTSGTPHPPLTTGAFGRALLALAILAAAAALSLRRSQHTPEDPFWRAEAALALVTSNLLAVFTGVREIAALWPAGTIDADAALKQGLAISAYLMLYGAALLAIGFWKRSTPLRWQGLALLLFTILKTFLYDMRNLSQGYRVASFLALGALLMAISFAYQRDWLNLRGTPSANTPQPSTEHTGNAR